MDIIDTHAHIYLEAFREDLDETIDQAQTAGVSRIYMPNIDGGTIDDMLETEQKFPGYCIPMMGLHPGSVNENFEKELEKVESWLNARQFAAVGEIGIDLYWDKTYEEEQKAAFRYQIELAKKHQLPIVIHFRKAFAETIQIVEELIDPDLTGIFHCFTGSLAEAKKIISLGFHCGIGGVATFKNGGLDTVIPYLDHSFMALETDSPYLAPVPYRGKRNQPAFLRHIAEKVAEYKSVEVEEVARKTTANALKLFKL